MDIVKMEEDAPPPLINQEKEYSLPALTFINDVDIGADVQMDEHDVGEISLHYGKNKNKNKKEKFVPQPKFRTPEEEARRQEKMATRKARRSRDSSYQPSDDSEARPWESDRVFAKSSNPAHRKMASLEDSFSMMEQGTSMRQSTRREPTLADLYPPTQLGYAYGPDGLDFVPGRYQSPYGQSSNDTNIDQPEIAAGFAGVPRGPRSRARVSMSYEVIGDESSIHVDPHATFAGVPTGPRAEVTITNSKQRRRKDRQREQRENYQAASQNLDPTTKSELISTYQNNGGPKRKEKKTASYMEAEAETEAALAWSRLTEEERLHSEQKYIKVKGGSHRFVKVDQNAQAMTVGGYFNEDTYVWKSISLRDKNKEIALAKKQADDSAVPAITDQMMIDEANEKKSQNHVSKEEANDLAEDAWEDLPENSAGKAPNFFLPQPSMSTDDVNASRNSETAPTYTSQRITRLEKKRRQEKIENRKSKRVTNTEMDQLGDMFTSTSLSEENKTQPDLSKRDDDPEPNKQNAKKVKKLGKRQKAALKEERKRAFQTRYGQMSKSERQEFQLETQYQTWARKMSNRGKTRQEFDEARSQRLANRAESKKAKKMRSSALQDSVIERHQDDGVDTGEHITVGNGYGSIKQKAQRLHVTEESARQKEIRDASRAKKEEQFQKQRDEAEKAMEEKIRQVRMKNQMERLTKGLGNLLVPSTAED